MVKYENVRRYVIYESNVPKLCLYHLSLVTKRLGPDQTQIQHNSKVSSVWHRQLLWLRFGIFKLVLYNLYITYFTYIRISSVYIPHPQTKSNQALQWPNPNTSWPPRVQAYYLVIPCLSVKEPVHHGGVFFDLFLRNHADHHPMISSKYLIQAVSTCKWLYQVRFCVAVQADTCIMNHNSTLLQYGCAMGTYSWSTHDHSSGRTMIIVITRKLQ